MRLHIECVRGWQMTTVVAALAICGSVARGQARCEPEWRAFDPTTASYPGANAAVTDAVMWDPDGDGPEGEKIVMIGSFTRVGEVVARGVVMLDPETLAVTPFSNQEFATGITAITVSPSGALHIAADRRVHRWTDSAWSALTLQYATANVAIDHLLVRSDGTIVAAPRQILLGNGTPRGPRVWDGAVWSSLPQEFAAGSLINGMELLGADENIVVGGRIWAFGDVGIAHLAQWDGARWSAVDPMLSEVVQAMTVESDGALLLATSPDYDPPLPTPPFAGTRYCSIARWDGTRRNHLGVASGGLVTTIQAHPDGSIVLGGTFQRAGGVDASGVARFVGTTWTPIGSAGWLNLNRIAFVLPGSGRHVIVGGQFSHAGGVVSPNLARLAEGTWQTVRPGITGLIAAGAQTPNGLWISGHFNKVGNRDTSGLARWNGSEWVVDLPGLFARELLEEPSEGLYAVGAFTGSRNGTGLDGLRIWDGTAWNSVGGGLNNEAFALARLPNGDIVVAGNFTTAGGTTGVSANGVARWDGTAWHALGSGLTMPPSTDNNVAVGGALAVAANGDVYVGGGFAGAGGIEARNIARWDGSTWHALGSGINGRVNRLTLLPDGRLVAAGFFTSAGGVPALNVAVWDGASWSGLGEGVTGAVYAVRVLANGDIVVGGTLSRAGEHAVSGVARWNGQAWSPLGLGVLGNVYDLELSPEGDLIALGWFARAGNATALYIARFRCPLEPCDALDFNNDGLAPDDADVIDFANLLSGGPCPTCNDIDFNNDGLFPDDADIAAFLRVFAGGAC